VDSFPEDFTVGRKLAYVQDAGSVVDTVIAPFVLRVTLGRLEGRIIFWLLSRINVSNLRTIEIKMTAPRQLYYVCWPPFTRDKIRSFEISPDSKMSEWMRESLIDEGREYIPDHSEVFEILLKCFCTCPLLTTLCISMNSPSDDPPECCPNPHRWQRFPNPHMWQRFMPQHITDLSLSLHHGYDLQLILPHIPATLKRLKLGGGKPSGTLLRIRSDSLEYVDLKKLSKDTWVELIDCKNLKEFIVFPERGYYGSGFSLGNSQFSFDASDETYDVISYGDVLREGLRLYCGRGWRKSSRDAYDCSPVDVVNLPHSCILSFQY
jgi:hypothetical protein